jgi:site-specific recombinase XerD
MKTWLEERGGSDDDVVFPNARGTQLSPDGVQYLLAKHVATARKNRRSGHVFQNRYKSILCEKDVYLKELSMNAY